MPHRTGTGTRPSSATGAERLRAPALPRAPRRRAWAAPLVLILMAAPVASALACSCVRRAPLEAIEDTPFIFSGRVTDLRRPASSRNETSYVASIAVTDRWKGQMPDVALLYGYTGAGTCGLPLQMGQTVTLMAAPVPAEGPNPAGFGTNACMMAGLTLDRQPDWPGDYFAQREQAERSRSTGWKLLQTFRAERERLEAAIAASPGATEPLIERAQLLGRWRDTGAHGAYADLAARAPNLLAAHLGLARVLLGEKRPEEAKAPLDRARALAPDDAGVLQTVEYARFLAGDETVLQGLRDFQGLDLRPARRPVNLRSRDLREANFSDARFGYLDLSGADLRGVRFSGALGNVLNLSGADLRGADLTGVSAQQLSLDKARLDGTRIAGIDLSRRDLREASLRDVVGPDAQLSGAGLSGADLSGASLPGANLRGASLVNVRFGNARLVGADLYRTNLSGADLSRADIRGATFDEAFFDCRTRLPRGVTPQSLGMFAADPSAPPCR